MKDYPTPWRRKMMWAALTACFLVVLVVVVTAVIWASATTISFLQPSLIAVAIAAILTYLLAAFQMGGLDHPIAVIAIFIAIQNLEGLLYAPRIVGNYVGLHPMTVIVSIFVWGLIIGGVIGPLLAVPLTATLKMLFGRYVWGRRLREQALPIERVLAAEEIEVPTHH
jgi:predicted PurR-regulated permease PerM